MLAVAFEGCACRAAFHVGVVEWLSERGMLPEAVAGASSGSLVAAAVALGRAGELREGWEARLGLDIWQPGRVLRGRWPLTMSHVLREALRDHVGDVRLPDVPRPLAIAVTRLSRRGRVERVLTRSDDLPVAEAVAASSFLPGPYSRPTFVDRRPALDGAWQVRTPIAAARALGATRTLACVSDEEGRLLGGFFRIRAFPVPADVAVLAPIEPLALRGFDFDPPRTRHAFAVGRRSAEAFVRAREEWLAG